MEKKALNLRPLIAAGFLLGVGMGGFFDGILFHQILQIHSMLSNKILRTTLVNMEINMFWDGIFHAFTWLTTAAGIAVFWRAGKQGSFAAYPPSILLGSLLLGWGTFNTVEGLIDHHLLQLHHVVENAEGHLVGDVTFLGFGLCLILIGQAMIKRAARNFLLR